MKRFLLPFGLFFCLSWQNSIAQSPVWSADIAPILYNKCASCHHQGGNGPFSLISYLEAYSYNTLIGKTVTSKYMPPWPPDPGYSRLAHERLLTPQEINKIAQWVQDGAKEGDPALAPPAPTFSSGGDLPGTPDLEVKIPTYTSTATGSDVYQCFVIPSGVAADKYITAFEAIPGNRTIVHHVLVYADTTGKCAQLDAATSEPGYTSFGGVGEGSAKLIGGWVPGTAPVVYPQGFGVKLPQNADIVVQIHYPHGSNGKKDSTRVRFYFSSSPALRGINIDPVLNHVTNITPPLYIPANQTKTFNEHYEVPNLLNVSILGVAPHMHLIGKNISCFGVTPKGDTQKFIRINDWDFHWQGFYLFRNLVKVPAGTHLYSTAFYDNTSANPRNPSYPPKDVYAGEATTDEMMLTYFIWTFYQPGDENIRIDSTTPIDLKVKTNYYSGQQLLTPYPNPANDVLVVKYHFDAPATGSAEIADMNGRLVKQLMKDEMIRQGYTAKPYDISGLPAGTYILRLRTSERMLTEKIIIRR